MSIFETPLLMTVVIFGGMLAQVAYSRFFKRSKLVGLLLLLAWGVVGALLLWGSVRLIQQGQLLFALVNGLIGLGLSVSGWGRVTELRLMQVSGLVLLAASSILLGIFTLANGQLIAGMLSMGVGSALLIGIFGGWASAFSQISIGILIVASGVFTLVGLLPPREGQSLALTLLICALFFGFGLLAIWAGSRQLFLKRPQPARAS